MTMSESEQRTPQEVLEMNRNHTFPREPSVEKVDEEFCRRLRRSYRDVTDGGSRQVPMGFYDSWRMEFDGSVSRRTLYRHATGRCNHE